MAEAVITQVHQDDLDDRLGRVYAFILSLRPQVRGQNAPDATGEQKAQNPDLEVER